MKTRYYILTLILFWAGQVFAQDAKFTATVSKTTIGTGEQFELIFTVNGDGGNYVAPDLGMFQLLSGPNVSTSMEFFNGKATNNSTISYILAPIREGATTIGPASVIVKGQKLTTNPIHLTIVKGKPANRPHEPDADGNTKDLSKSLFMRAIIDKDNVYQGQQITVTYRIYTKVDILQSQVNKFPDLTGFWNEEIKPTQQAQFKVENYKGTNYNVADIKQIILFPEHAGNIVIDPFEMTFLARVQQSPRDFMDQFFGGNAQEVNYKAKSLPVTVHVKPLPTAGKPDSFTGAVGNFNIEASVDKNRLKANESLNYKVKVSGSGNIKLLKNLNTVFPADFEKYDPKIQDTVNETANGVSGSRIYNYLLIPRHHGDFTIDPIKFSYFNPHTGRYVSLTAPSFAIKVDKGLNETNVTALTGADKQDISIQNKDIRYIKTGGAELTRDGGQFYGSFTYYLLLLLGPVVAIGALAYRNRVRKNNSDLVLVKSRRAGKVAARHLAIAQKELQAQNTHAFYEAVFKGLYGYLSDKLNINYADLDRAKIAAALQARAVSEGVVNQLLDTLDLCEMARYAPVKHISAQEVFDKAKGIINAIENEI